MDENYIVRITKTELLNFKNVKDGRIKYVNYFNAEYRAQINESDIIGIYGQNGSGKTAVIEALDILRCVASGQEIDYDEYEGLFDVDNNMKLITTFYISNNVNKYKAEYEFELKKLKEEKKIIIDNEKLRYWEWKTGWRNEQWFYFCNPYYDTQSILNNENVEIETKNKNVSNQIGFFNSIKNIAILCAQQNVSVFFNDAFITLIKEDNDNYTDKQNDFRNVIYALYKFALMELLIVKVNQLGVNYSNNFIPMNIHAESDKGIIQGCIPLFVNGRGEFPEEIYQKLQKIVEAINIALKSIVSNLQIKLLKLNEEVNDKGIKMVPLEVYAIRGEKEFLIKYESEGIKRIISLLNFLISMYNNPGVCLVVDELDAGVFEYLLGELLGVLSEQGKGQLIFTSHNLRVLERLDKKNIICTTVNPFKRYIPLKGIEKNHNKRDFYIRSIVLGGQEESLYDDSDLIDMGYAFKRAGCLDDCYVDFEFPQPVNGFLESNDKDENEVSDR